jgi:hypothetical protein
MTQQNNIPNVYQLGNQDILITFTVSNANGVPQLDYVEKNDQNSRTFSGNDISVVDDSPLGKLVTVFLVRTVDTGSSTLTLLVPGVNLVSTTQQNIKTCAIITNNLFSILKARTPRQTQEYQVYELDGTAST